MTQELKVIISAEIGKFKSAVAEAQGKIDELASSDSKLSKLNEGFSKVGDVAKKGLQIAAGAVVGVTTALMALGPATEEYRTGMAKLTTAFESVGGSAETAKGAYNDLYRVLGDSDVAVEAAGHLAKLTTNEQELAEWTDICQGVYATFGDSLPIEGLTEAANETAKVGQLTGSLADALNWAGVNEEEFQAKLDACNTEAEREALIRDTLNGLYSEASATYEKNAAGLLAQNEANAKMTEAMAKLGEVTAPIMTMLTELGATILADLTPYIEEFAANHLPAIKDALADVGEKIGKVITWIADNWELVSTLGAIILGVATAISVVSTAIGAYTAIMGVASAVTLPVIGTIAGIVAGIAAVVAIIVVCVKHWDEITAAIKNFGEKAKEIISKVVEAIKGFFTDMMAKVSETVEKIKTAVVEKFTELKTKASDKAKEIKEDISKKWGEMKDKVSTTMNETKNSVTTTLQNMKSAYQTNGGGIKGIVSATMEGIKGYYKTGYTFINSLTNGKLGELLTSFKTKLDQVKNTVNTVLNNVKTKFSNIMDNVKSIVSNAVQKLKDLFDFDWDLPKIKLPHFKITGKFSLDPPSIPRISVDWYARGGVFDAPTLFGYGNGQIGGLGENGAEAIVPLENNTEWLDKIADRLMGKRVNTPIILQVDGKTFAETSIESINNLTRQTGKLSLVMV